MGIKISKETELDLLKLGLYQIIGGIIGIILLTLAAFAGKFDSGIVWLSYLLIFSFFAFSVFCGILCLSPKKNALQYSLINQILQVLGFTIGGLTFKYIAGVYFTFSAGIGEKIIFDFGIGISKFVFNSNMDDHFFKLDINLVALAIIFWIIKMIKKVKEEIELRTEIDIGNDLHK